MALSRPLLESLLRIRNLTELAAFKGYLQEELTKVDGMIRNSNDDRMTHQMQGDARRLESLLKLIEDSASYLEKGRQ